MSNFFLLFSNYRISLRYLWIQSVNIWEKIGGVWVSGGADKYMVYKSDKNCKKLIYNL